MNVYKTSTIRLTLTSSNSKIATSSKNKNFLDGKLISSYIRDTGLARMIHRGTVYSWQSKRISWKFRLIHAGFYC